MCCMLFGLELHRRLGTKGVVCNMVHPGKRGVPLEITRNWWLWKVVFTMVRPFSKNKVKFGYNMASYVFKSIGGNKIHARFIFSCGL